MKRFLTFFFIVIATMGVFYAPAQTITPFTHAVGTSDGVGEDAAAAQSGVDGSNDILGSAATAWFSSNLKWGTAWLARQVLNLFALLLSFAAVIFDLVLDISIVQFYQLANLEAITVTWQLCRDMANMFFIFIMLYIAIGTILDLQGVDYKKMIISVIISAVMINFSMLIAKLIIDPTNVLALQFYNKIEESAQIETAGGNIDLRAKTAFGAEYQVQHSISALIVNALDLTSVYNIGNNNTSEGIVSASSITERDNSLSFANIILSTFLGSILILVTTFVIFTAAVLFFIRMLTLLILLAFSPIPFLFRALPFGQLETFRKKWWDTLFAQAIWAPIYMFLLYFAIYAMNASQLQELITRPNVFDRSALGILTKSNGNIVIFYFINIGFLLATIAAAKSFGATGLSFATSTAAWANRKGVDFLGSGVSTVASGVGSATNSVAGRVLGESNRDAIVGGIRGVGSSVYNKTASYSGGRAIIRGVKGVSGVVKEYNPLDADNIRSGIKKVYGDKFGVDILTSSKDIKENKEKKAADIAKDVGKSLGANKSLEAVQKYMILSDEDKAAVYNKLSDSEKYQLEQAATQHKTQGGAVVLDSILGKEVNGQRVGGLKKKLSEEDQEKIDEAGKKVEDRKYQKAGKTDIKNIKELLKKIKDDPTYVPTQEDFDKSLGQLATLDDAGREKYYLKLSPENRLEFDTFAEKYPSVTAAGKQINLAEGIKKWRRAMSDEDRNKTNSARSKKSMDELDMLLEDTAGNSTAITSKMDQITPRDFARRIDPEVLAREIAIFAPKLTPKHLQELSNFITSPQHKFKIKLAIESIGQQKTKDYLLAKGREFWG